MDMYRLKNRYFESLSCKDAINYPYMNIFFMYLNARLTEFRRWSLGSQFRGQGGERRGLTFNEYTMHEKD